MMQLRTQALTVHKVHRQAFGQTWVWYGMLRKVGGGYIFIHRYLLEYFAGLER